MKRFSNAVLSLLLIGMVLWIAVSLLSQRPISIATLQISTETAEATFFPTLTEESTAFPTDAPTETQEMTPFPIETVETTPVPTADSPLPTPMPTEDLPIYRFHFSEPQQIFTSAYPASISDISQDAQRVLLQLHTNDSNFYNQIVSVDIPTGQVTTYGQREYVGGWHIDQLPTWIDSVNAVAYNYTDFDFTTFNNQAEPELRVAYEDHTNTVVDMGEFYLASLSSNSYLYYLKSSESPLLKIFDVAQRQNVFQNYAGLRSGKLRLNQQGTQIVSVQDTSFQILDLQSGSINEISIDTILMQKPNLCLHDNPEAGLRADISDVQWSKSGQKQAVIIDCVAQLLVANQLLVFDSTNQTWQMIDSPTRFIEQVNWLNDDRHLILTGAKSIDGNYAVTVFLLDTVSMKQLQPSQLPADALISPGEGVRLSPNGKRLLLQGGVDNQGSIYIVEISYP